MMVRSRRYAGGIEVALPIEDLVREAFAALSGGTLRLEVRDVLANHEHAVTLAMVHVERAGRRLEHHGVFVSHITEGKATELWRKA